MKLRAWWVLGVVVLLGGCMGKGHSFVTAQPTAGEVVVFDAVRVFDSRAAQWLDGERCVVVKQAKIAAVLPAGDAVCAQAENKTSGGYLLPGLIDVHTHLTGDSAPPWALRLGKPEETLTALLYAGVTTALDLGAPNDDALVLGREVAAGKRAGPRVFAAGPMLTVPGSHPHGMVDAVAPRPLAWWIKRQMARTIATPANAAAVVDEVVALGADVVKVALDRIPANTPRMDKAVLQAVVTAAHAKNKRVFAHIGHSEDALDAALAGVDVLAHGITMEQLSPAALAALTEKKLPVACTLAVFAALERLMVDKPELNAWEREIIDDELRGKLFPVPAAQKGEGAIQDWIRAMATAHTARAENCAAIFRAGVPVLVGSDSPNVGHFAGAGLHTELAMLADGVMTKAQALAAATFVNATALAGPDADFGEIAVGKRADLVLLKDDPTASLDAFFGLRVVMKDGVSYLRKHR